MSCLWLVLFCACMCLCSGSALLWHWPWLSKVGLRTPHPDGDRAVNAVQEGYDDIVCRRKLSDSNRIYNKNISTIYQLSPVDNRSRRLAEMCWLL
ncbi:hypothetical protein BZA70DRAFT_193036 [Myxozyma melibiosi]|uniref:Secreted protein n=1 Tax=Myxozyma melibiosi TaxID=54550 RepID=A0ABR1F3N7_9ASCO